MEFLIILIVAALAQLFLPWWIIALVPFVVCMWLSRSGWKAFFLSFAALCIVWGVFAWYLHDQSHGIMSDRISQIFFLPNGLAMVGVAALVGGLVAGSAGLAGYHLRAMFVRKNELVYRR